MLTTACLRCSTQWVLDDQGLFIEVFSCITTTHQPTRQSELKTFWLNNGSSNFIIHRTALSLCDFFVFPLVKKLRGVRFQSAEAAVKAYIEHVESILASEWSS